MTEEDDLQARVRALRERFVDFQGASETDFMIAELVRLELTLERLGRRVEATEFSLSARDLLLPVAPKTTVAQWPIRARIDADVFLPSENGFHYLEHDEQGHPYRWTGPAREFGFELFLDRRSALPFSLELSGAESRILGLAAFADGDSIVLRRQKQKSRVVVSGVLPPAKSATPTWLQFQVPEVVRPKDQNANSQDERLLGLAFHSLEVGEKSR